MDENFFKLNLTWLDKSWSRLENEFKDAKILLGCFYMKTEKKLFFGEPADI